MPNSIYMDIMAILAALDDAVKLGADVINASYCNYYSSYLPIEQTAYQNIENTGIFLAAAAGNNGRLLDEGQPPLTPNRPDDFTIAFPSTMDHVTSVAAAEVSAFQYETYPFHLEGSDETLPFIDYSQQASAESFHSFVKYFNNQTLDTVYCGNGDSEDIADKDLRGKIAVFHRHQLSYVDLYYKCYDLINLGAIGVILIKDEDDITQNDIYKYYLPIPTALVLPKDSAPFEENPRIHFDANEVDIASATAKGTPSDFSSWGVATDLTLKPDISAPGNGFYTALPSASHDQYTHLQGTSVATPHIAGAAALLKQYIQSHPAQYTSLNQQAPLHGVIKNLMMSTATVITNEEGMAYSPRQQGAGLINLKAATETPVILLGDDGQSKLSLGNDIGDNVTFSFTAQNLSDEDVTYDALALCVNGDDVNADGLVEGVTALETTGIALPDAVTVPAGGSATIDVRVDLDKVAMKERMKVFTNGFFVDGYVTLATTDGSVPEVHLPFTGFYGDWAAMTAMDAPYYSKDSAMKMTGLGSTIQGFYLSRLGTEDFIYSLNNPDIPFYQLFEFPVNDHADAYSAISPNGDGIIDELQVFIQPLCEMTDFTVLLKDSKGKTLYEEKHEDVVYKSSLTTFEVPQDVIDSLSDGDYQVTVSGRFNYEGAESETITMPFAVDRTAPTVEDWQLNEDGILTMTATDDRAIMGAIAFSEDAEGQTSFADAIATPDDDTLTLDLTDMNLDNLEVSVSDYAGNIWTGYGKDGRLFADVPTDAWYAGAVDYVSSNGLMVGVEEGKFAPMMTTTRAQLVTTLWRLAEEPEATHSADFSDVSSAAYYTDAVAWAAEEGLLSGTTATTMQPKATANRAQLAVVLSRYDETLLSAQ